MLKYIIVIVLSSFYFSSFSRENKENDFQKDLRHLFEINGTKRNYEKSIKTIIEHYKKSDSDVPAAYWEKMEKEFLVTSADEIIDLMIPIYQKHLRHDDVKKMIEFFESDAGKRIASNMSVIMTESMEAGMLFGKKVSEKINQDIENKGYKIRLPFMK
jgi:hypothetical protein